MTKTKDELFIINHFGVPEIDGINPSDLELITNGSGIPGTANTEFECKHNNYRFCLVKHNELIMEPILIMDFFKRGRLVSSNTKDDGFNKRFQLETLWVKDNYRNKGIATFYLNKFIEMMQSDDSAKVKVYATIYPDADFFHELNYAVDRTHNALTKDQILAFLKKHETDRLKFEITNLQSI